MSSSAKALDPAFQGAGQRVGTEIWRIENFQPVPLAKTEHGKFYMGDCYIVLRTISGKGGQYMHDIHFWIGKDSSQDETGTAAIKTIELDAALGGRAVQRRELQGHESDKFLSYFKPCIVPLEGGIASGFKKPEEQEFETRLYVCRGKRFIKLKQVPFARSSLNHDDVFILDTEKKIYQFNGANSNIQERAKALEVVQFLKDTYHEGVCDVAIVEDGKLDTESDSGEFWVLFGGFAPIGKKVASDNDIVPEATPAKLYSITDGEVKPMEGDLSKGLLENNKCYLLDRGVEIFVWVGRITQVDERKVAIQVAEEFIKCQNRPNSTRFTRVIQGYETQGFKSNFDSWPSGSAAPAPEEGRGKVAALLKQQGVGLKGIAKVTTVNEEVPPLLEGDGKMEVWRIDDSAKTPLPNEDIGKFYDGDCYIILYNYHSGERKEDYFLCWWIGKDSVEDDQKMAARLANTMSNTLKGRPVQGRIFQGKEPPQLVALFQPMLILKGGLSLGYKNKIAEKGLTDDTYTQNCVALLRISGVASHNNKAVQVEAAASLNSTECFILQSGSSVFIWYGNQSTFEQQQLAVKVAEFMKPGVALKHTKEGTESSAFWTALGGKQNYTSKRITSEAARDSHLYTFTLNKEKFEVEEICNFTQDDLLTEDVLILDTQAEIFVWVGQSVDPKEKQSAFEIGQKYIDMAASVESLAPDVPLYKITEGNEPCFFTTFFSWDSAKTNVYGNSFQKKAALLFGIGHALEDKSNGSSGGNTQRASALAALNSAFSSSAEKPSSTEKSNVSDPSGPRQRAAALAALSSAFNSSSMSKPSTPRSMGINRGSQRAAAVAALSTVLTSELGSPDNSPMQSSRPEGSPIAFASEAEGDTVSVTEDSLETSEDSKSEVALPVLDNNDEDLQEKPDVGKEDNDDTESSATKFSYDRLKSKSENPVTGIDLKKREAYLSDEEFMIVFGMAKEAFYKLPRWKQDLSKKKVDLF